MTGRNGTDGFDVSIRLDPRCATGGAPARFLAAVKESGTQSASILATGPAIEECRGLRDEAARAGLRVSAWIVGMRDRRSGESHPDRTLRNALGERMPWSLCPSHPEARDLAIARALEAARELGPDALELEAFGFGGCVDPDARSADAGGRLDGARRFLLSLCFCEHCARRFSARQLPGARLAEKVARTIAELRESPTAATASLERPEEIGPWLAGRLGARECAGLLSARRECVVSLVGELRRRLPRPIRLAVTADPSPFVTGAAIGGGLLALGEVVDGFILDLSAMDAERVAAAVRSARSAATPDTRFLAVLAPPPAATDGSLPREWVERVRAARAAGVRGLRLLAGPAAGEETTAALRAAIWA